MIVAQNFFTTLSSVTMTTPPSTLHVDSSSLIFSTSFPSTNVLGFSSPGNGFLDLTVKVDAVILMSKSLPRKSLGTPTRTLHSSMVCVHLYRGVDPPLPTGFCRPSSLYVTPIMLPICSSSFFFVAFSGVCFLAGCSSAVVFFLASSSATGGAFVPAFGGGGAALGPPLGILRNGNCRKAANKSFSASPSLNPILDDVSSS
mmetsp:Transcript_103891/g.155558  ORF Transcript_103891/g.155558 Transcript_103891/m.155558 type:complete len:201 (+) Transcript_103891:473-1075(+)